MESFKYFCSHGDTACCSYRQLFVKIPLVVSSISGLYSVVCGSACSCFDMISILHDSRKLVPKKKKRNSQKFSSSQFIKGSKTRDGC